MTAFVQTPRGAVAFIRVVPAAGSAPSQVHLRDAIMIQPDAGGGFHVRTSDLPALQAAGMTQDTASTSSAAQFQAGVVAGSGAGTAI